MSRIGKKAIELPAKVTVKFGTDGAVNVEGPKGKLSVKLPARVKVEVKDGQVTVAREDDSREARSLHGLTRTILANAAKGVSTGFEKKLDDPVRHIMTKKDRLVTVREGANHDEVVELEIVVVVQHDGFGRGSDGWQLHPVVASRDHDHRIDKPKPSVFTNTDLASWLDAHDIDTVSIVGYMTHNCNASTVFEAHHRGLNAEFLSDATGSLPYANRAGSASADGELLWAQGEHQTPLPSRTLVPRTTSSGAKYPPHSLAPSLSPP